MRLAAAQLLNQCTHLREHGDNEALPRLVAIGNDASGVQINVGARERAGFGLAESGESDEIDEVGALLSLAVLGLRPDVGNDLLELVERRGQPDWRGAPTVLEMRRRAVSGASKVAPEGGQLAPGQLVVIRAELLAVKLAAKPDAGEILTVRVVAVKAGGFRLRPYVV